MFTKVDECEKRWREHILPIRTGCIPKAAYFYATQGNRNVGKPRKRRYDV